MLFLSGNKHTTCRVEGGVGPECGERLTSELTELEEKDPNTLGGSGGGDT